MIYLSQRAQRRKAGLMIDFGLFSAAAFAENNGQPADIYEFAENKLASEPCLCAFAPLRETLTRPAMTNA